MARAAHALRKPRACVGLIIEFFKIPDSDGNCVQ